MTTHTRRRLILSLVVAALTLPAELILVKALGTDAQTSSASWVDSLSETSLALTAEDTEDYPFQYRKDIMRRLTPDKRAKVWTRHIARYRDARPELSTDQVDALNAAIEAAQATLLSPGTTPHGRPPASLPTATPELFDQSRGRGVGGPHRWDTYWKVVEMAVSVFEKFNVGIHLIVGLGETEEEMVEIIQKGQEMGAYTHLFSFFPEKGSPMQDHRPPSLDHYRRIQIAQWVINEGLGTASQMIFDEKGQLVDFGMDIRPLIESGEPFMTSGCPGRDGKVACNRPYGNERPSGPIRNFPFMPEKEDGLNASHDGLPLAV